MDLIAHFSRLFAYDAWANQEALASLRQSATPVPRALQWMAHIFAAQRIWIDRLEYQPQSIPVWPDFTAEQCQQQAAELSVLWKNYLAATTEADLAQTITYKNSQGDSWSSRKDDILMHLILHAAHHRGQVASAVRAAGFTPAYTDFIHSIRRGFVP